MRSHHYLQTFGNGLFGRWALFAIAFAMACATSANAAETSYGQIELLRGSVSILDAKGQARTPKVDDKIFVGETIVTGRNGELQVRTDDSGFVAFRANTRMKVEAYAAEGDKDDNMVVSLIYGTLRSVTGWIGKHNPGNYRIRTPAATIGIRGTDHEPHVVLPAGPGEAPPSVPPGTYEKVNSGATVIKNEGGQTIVGPNQAGFAAHDGKAAPRSLERIPDIYKPGANESRIESRGKELAKELEEKRAARQKDVAERKAKEEAHKKIEKRRHKPADK